MLFKNMKYNKNPNEQHKQCCNKLKIIKIITFPQNILAQGKGCAALEHLPRVPVEVLAKVVPHLVVEVVVVVHQLLLTLQPDAIVLNAEQVWQQV
jgi:hypothetical protein